jgi:small GTP-binding protein
MLVPITKGFNHSGVIKQMVKKDFVFKIAVLGSFAIGKTSLISQFCERQFKEDYKPTLGASIIIKDVKLFKDRDEFDCRLVLWDIAGQEKYENVRQMYFQGCAGAILVYDLTRIPTFSEIRTKWVVDFRENAVPGACSILIGNKKDLEGIRNVSTEEGENLANEINAAAFLETSAKTGENVESSFLTLVRKILLQTGEVI